VPGDCPSRPSAPATGNLGARTNNRGIAVALDYEIKSVRLAPADDDSHLHIELIGYASPHVEGEEIMIPIPRALQKMAFSEKFHVVVDGQPAEVKPGKCATCGFEPYLVTPADRDEINQIEELPQK
jgi:hypothetical protein